MSIDDNSFFHHGGDCGVLLIHGLTGTPTEMKFIGKGLAKAGFTVHGVQLAGHCGSEADLLATGWPDWYRSVEEAHDRLAAQCGVVFAAGLSMGAVLALHLAARRPESVRGLALYSTTLKYDGWSIPRLSFLLPLMLRLPLGRRYRFVESFPYGIKDERLRKRVVANMHAGNSAAAGLAGTPGLSLRELWGLVAAVKAEMRSIVAPALVMHAQEDDVASPQSNAAYLARHLGGAVETVLLDDCYHMITVDRQRHDVVRHSAEFFRSLAPAVPQPEPTPSLPADRPCPNSPSARA